MHRKRFHKLSKLTEALPKTKPFNQCASPNETIQQKCFCEELFLQNHSESLTSTFDAQPTDRSTSAEQNPLKSEADFPDAAKRHKDACKRQEQQGHNDSRVQAAQRTPTPQPNLPIINSLEIEPDSEDGIGTVDMAADDSVCSFLHYHALGILIQSTGVSLAFLTQDAGVEVRFDQSEGDPPTASPSLREDLPTTGPSLQSKPLIIDPLLETTPASGTPHDEFGIGKSQNTRGLMLSSLARHLSSITHLRDTPQRSLTQ